MIVENKGKEPMKKSTQLRLSAGSFAVGLALAATPAFAQDTEVSTEDSAEALGENAIVVTGSRISNPNLELSSPVAAVTADDIDLRQANVAEEILREIPGVVPSIGAQVNNGNGGSTFLNLRGIGANRNIVLLNGTRVIPAGLAGITNVDVIPLALIERTDVLTGGAGAAYGADAIGGVVNFITKNNFEGVELSVTQALTERGDGETFRADFTLGGNFDDGRGNATLSLGYTNRDQVLQGDRDFSVFNISSITGNAGGSSTAAPTRLSLPGLGFQQVTDDGSTLVDFDRPFNFNPFNLFQLPLEQFRIFGTANYEITDGIEMYGEGLFVQSTNTTAIAPSGSFGVNAPLPLNNPFLNDNIRNIICGAQGIAQADCDAAGATPFGPNLADGSVNPDFLAPVTNVARRFVELGPRLNERETRLFQVKAGIRGDITDSIEFDVFGAYGESDLRSRQSGNGTRTRLDQSLFSVDPNQCIDPTGGCVPIDLFGPVGSITQEVGAFLDVGNFASTATTLGQLQGFVSGDLFTVPSADQPVNFVVGAEYREYTAFTASDQLTQTPGEVLGNGAAAPNQGGSFDVSELFGELVIPIVSGVSFAEQINLELGGRVSDYSTTGTEYTWKAGGSWTITDGFTIRGNYQQVTRAPNIGELFQPQITGLDNSSEDPCQGTNPVGDAALQAVCLAQGAPANSIGFIIPDPAGQINVTTGGNPNLAAEDAETYTIGFIFEPAAIPGLAITADYYNISITDAITNPTVGDVFASCFGQGFSGAGGAPNLPAGAAGSAACNGIIRNPFTGNLFGDVAITPGLPQVLTNQGEIATDGIDVSLNYSRDFGAVGWNLSVLGNWTNSSTFNANANDPNSLNRECVGFFSTNCGSIQPEFSFTTRNTISVDRFDISLLWRYIDAVEIEPEVAGNFLPEFESIGSENYFDLTVRANATENLDITLAVINLFDNDPTVVGSDVGTTAFNSGNVFPSTYDPLGRRFSITARLNF